VTENQKGVARTNAGCRRQTQAGEGFAGSTGSGVENVPGEQKDSNKRHDRRRLQKKKAKQEGPEKALNACRNELERGVGARPKRITRVAIILVRGQRDGSAGEVKGRKGP